MKGQKESQLVERLVVLLPVDDVVVPLVVIATVVVDIVVAVVVDV